jgi:hypothetical protein
MNENFVSVPVMANVLRSGLNLTFYRDRVRQCLELAEVSRSVPSIKFRLEALAQHYQQRIEFLERTSQASPPLAPDQHCDSSVQSMLGTVSANILHHSE